MDEHLQNTNLEQDEWHLRAVANLRELACLLRTEDDGYQKAFRHGSGPAFSAELRCAVWAGSTALGPDAPWLALMCAHCKCRSQGLLGWKQRSLCHSDNISVWARLKPLSEFRMCSKITRDCSHRLPDFEAGLMAEGWNSNPTQMHEVILQDL